MTFKVGCVIEHFHTRSLLQYARTTLHQTYSALQQLTQPQKMCDPRFNVRLCVSGDFETYGVSHGYGGKHTDLAGVFGPSGAGFPFVHEEFQLVLDTVQGEDGISHTLIATLLEGADVQDYVHTLTPKCWHFAKREVCG